VINRQKGEKTMIKYTSSGFALAVALAATSGPVFAQNAPQAAGDAANAGDIIVTAQRRDESLSKTPVAVTVVSADTLAEAQVVTEQDLRSATPGLAVRATLNSNQLNYSLRGQSQDAFSGTRPGVLPYINEFQIGNAGGATAFYDLANVQVLKGPQGTLFGRSATGGAVLFTTAKPTDHLSGYASALAGNYGAFKGEAAISGPIAGDKLTARLAGFYSRRNGFQLNLFDGGREGDYKRYGFRGSVTAKLSDSIKNELVVDYYRSDSENTVAILSGLLPFTGAPPPYIPAELLYAGVATPVARGTGQAVLTGFITPAVGAATAAILAPPAYDRYFADPRRPVGGLRGALNEQLARGPYIVSSDATNVYRTKNWVITNATTIDVGANAKIRNIFGYSHQKSFTAFDTDGTGLGIGGNGIRGVFDAPDACVCNTSRQVSDELQLSGKALDGKLDYVTGLYFSDEKSTNFWRTQFFDIVGTVFGIPAAQDLHNDFEYRNKTKAGYAQGTYHVNDSGLAVTLGLRYTSEKVAKHTFPSDSGRATLIAAGTPAPDDQATTFKRLSWQFGVQDQVNNNLLLYAVTRRAYKSGGYNGSVSRTGTALVGGDFYLGEKVTDAEAGVKYQGDLDGHPVRLAVAVFHNWLENSQRTAYTAINGGPAAITVNVPKGKVYGIEFEALFKPTDHFAIGGTFNYTKSSYSGVAAGAAAIPGCKGGVVVANAVAQCFDRVPDTPKASGTIFADFTLPLSGDLEASLHGDVYHQAKSFTGPRSENNEGTTIDGYYLTNFRLGIGDKKVGWSLTANLKNAFNKVYYVGGVNSGEIFQVNTFVPGEPRTVTVEARFKF
jgi:iron complex outermembrane recepter protein